MRKFARWFFAEAEVQVKKRTDQERLDWLEWRANERYGLLLHAQAEPTGRTGLGLAYPKRSLRDAIDQAMECDVDWERQKAARINRARDQGMAQL